MPLSETICRHVVSSGVPPRGRRHADPSDRPQRSRDPRARHRRLSRRAADDGRGRGHRSAVHGRPPRAGVEPGSDRDHRGTRGRRDDRARATQRGRTRPRGRSRTRSRARLLARLHRRHGPRRHRPRVESRRRAHVRLDSRRGDRAASGRHDRSRGVAAASRGRACPRGQDRREPDHGTAAQAARAAEGRLDVHL